MGRKILADAGYEVLTVNNGSAALKKIAEGKPDLIVLDVYMPGYSGLEVCQRLKEASETAKIPILLTVGKLEPFKPEEAKRVRAEGFIVKPFEASELLSALSKLEDKIVPRAESSKPGRFARAIAAVEGGRRDPLTAGGEDVSWKERISFPSPKKDSPPDNVADDSTIYNPMNTDLRTVVDRGAPTSADNGTDKSRVDLGALAPAGLPKDVTPEEIAALAAAAAQIKGSVTAEPQASPDEKAAPVEAETKQETAVAASAVEAIHIDEAAQAAPAQATADFPGPASAENNKASEESPSVAAETDPAAPSGAATTSHEETEPEPVTMAAAAAGTTAEAKIEDASERAARWIAVPVALLPEEASLSLEREFQQASAAAAIVAQEATLVAPASAAEAQATSSTPGPAEPLPGAASAPETHSEVAQSLNAIAAVATDAISAAVKELEAVASSLVEPQSSIAEAPAPTSPATSDTTAKAEVSLAHPTDEAIAQSPVPEIVATGSQTTPVEETNSSLPEPAQEQVLAPNAAADSGPVPTSAIENTLETESTKTVEPEPQHTNNGAPRKESDLTETTAAAWENWRRVRQGGDGPAPATLEEAAMAVAAGAEKSPEAAMATSEPDSESADVASIVDSVLADLRPRIVEEISRKLGKKK